MASMTRREVDYWACRQLPMLKHRACVGGERELS